MTLFAATILKIFAWIWLGLGAACGILFSLTSAPLFSLPQQNTNIVIPGGLGLLTLLPIIMWVLAALIGWAVLICVASMAENLHHIRYGGTGYRQP